MTRDAHIRLIRTLHRHYQHNGIGAIVQSALIGKAGLESLSDDELLTLQRDIDYARECLIDGIASDHAGPIRSASI